MTVHPATYPETPQSVRQGSLLGPFHGTVRDATTGYAIKNARVTCIWNVSRGERQTPIIRVTHTDINGRYYMPMLRFNPGFVPHLPLCADSVCRERIDDVQIVIEHADYFPYISSMASFLPVQFPSRTEAPLPPQAGTEFYQLDNVVRLKKLTMEPPLHRKAVLFIDKASTGADEIYYRAAAELTDEGEWGLDATGLLSALDIREELDSDELPRVKDRVFPDAFGRTFRFDLDDSDITMHVLRGPVSLLSRWVRSNTLAVQTKLIVTELDAEIWHTIARTEKSKLLYVFALLPHDGLLFSISCPETTCRSGNLEKLIRTMITRKRSIRIVQKSTGVSFDLLRVVFGQNPLHADRAEWLQVFTDARLHHWIQTMYTMPLGIYESIDITHAEKLQQRIMELPSTLAILPDAKKQIRILGLLVNGALYRALKLQNVRPPVGPSQETVLKWLRAAALESREGVRQSLLAYAFFTMGQYIVPDAPSPGLRTRLQSFCHVLMHGRPGAELDERGWMVFEPTRNPKRVIISNPSQLYGVGNGRLLLLFASGKMQSLPWPPPPELKMEYPKILQF